MKEMDVEKLVEAIKLRPVLFKASSSSYREADTKLLAWREVGEGVGNTGKYLARPRKYCLLTCLLLTMS